MKKVFVYMFLVLFTACKHHEPRTPKNLGRSADNSHKNQCKEESEVVAPPPSYGNKIVMR